LIDCFVGLFILLKVQDGMFYFMMITPYSIFFYWKLVLKNDALFFVCGVAVFRWIWIPRDIVWADISMLPCFIYWKGWIFFSLPFAAISVHWYDFELVSKRMAVSVCLLIDIFLICGLRGFKFYGNYLLIGERHFFCSANDQVDIISSSWIKSLPPQ
jgi:hypothetical protein